MDIVGEVTGHCAEETGLEKGTPVVAGGGDWACTFYGAGFTKPRRGVDMCGTVDGLVIGGENFVIDYDKGLSSWTNIVPNLHIAASAGTQTAGNILRWCRDEFFAFEKQVGEKFGISPYKLMDIEAETVPAGSGGVIVTPHHNAQRSPKNTNSRGLIYGLTLMTKRAQIIRAIMEGIAYELRLDLEKFRSTSGIPCDEIRAIGGGAKSKLWRQIKADIIQIPFCKINIDEGGNLGTAVLAGFAVGLYSDLIKPIEENVRVVERELPTESNKKVYNEMFNLYCRINEVLEQSKYYETFAEKAKELFPK